MRISLGLLSICTLGLVACGGSGSDSTPSVANTPTPAPTVNAVNPTNSTSPTPTPSVQPTGNGFPFVVLWDKDSEEYEKNIIGATAINNMLVAIKGELLRPVDGKIVYDYRKLGQGMQQTETVTQYDAVIAGQLHQSKSNIRLRTYQQPNSIVLGNMGSETLSGPVSNFTDIDKGLDTWIVGRPTKVLPDAGVYNYKGVAFDKDSQGSFDYRINFGTQTGEGTIGLDGKTLTLQTGSINHSIIGRLSGGSDELQPVHYIHSNVTNTGSSNAGYQLGIYGEDATEVAGRIYGLPDNDEIGFGGHKQ